MEKKLIHVWKFVNGSTGRNVWVGSIKRDVRKRKLYLPHKDGALSPCMEWREVRIVTICGVDYIPDLVFANSGEQKVGDLIVFVGPDAKLPNDLSTDTETWTKMLAE